MDRQIDIQRRSMLHGWIDRYLEENVGQIDRYLEKENVGQVDRYLEKDRQIKNAYCVFNNLLDG